MKRLSVLLCLLLLLLLAGCGSKDSTVPKIEDYSWQMTTAQSIEAEGQAVAYGPGNNSTLETAVEILLTCTAADGTITLTDETIGQTYSGTYKLTETDQQTSTYEVTVGETEGMAVVSMTTYHDDSQTPTFIISLGDYALNFFPIID